MAWRYQGRIATGPYTGLWRVGLSIETMGKQVDALWPGRGKASDGTLGNTAHQNRRSDHNPNISDGPFDVVTAIDITDDDAAGADMALVAEAIRVARDNRVKYCLVPGTRVLMADLSWRPIETVHPGDELLAFDEFGSRPTTKKGHAGARLRTAVAEATRHAVLPCSEIITDRGSVIASDNHLWLQARAYQGSYRQWKRTSLFREGDLIQAFADPWDMETSFEAGWLAGLFDGEGCLSRPAAPPRPGWNLQVSQQPGPVLDQAQQLLDVMKFQTKQHAVGSTTMSIHIRGGLPEILHLLGQVPTQRLYRKAITERIWEGHHLSGTWPHATVQEVRPIGPQEVIALQTSTRTFIAEGLFSHNCIHNRRMFASYSKTHRAAWEWGPYSGTNAHLSHMHLSVSKSKALYDDGAPWPIGEDQEDNDVEFWIQLLKAQADPYWPALQAATGSPAGDAMYWSQTGTASGSKASDAEWLTAAPELSAASLQAGVMATGGDLGDVDTLVDTAIAEHAENPDAHHA